jgi:DNA-binding protein YbaB
MVTDHRTQVAELVADYRRSREALASVHKSLATVSATATSPDGLVTATVGAKGTLTDLVIEDAAYQRLRPAELARLVLSTTAAAATKAARAAASAIGPLLPAGSDPEAMLAGTADLRPEEIMPEPARRPASLESTEDDEDSFENRSWLDDSATRKAGA